MKEVNKIIADEEPETCDVVGSTVGTFNDKLLSLPSFLSFPCLPPFIILSSISYQI